MNEENGAIEYKPKGRPRGKYQNHGSLKVVSKVGLNRLAKFLKVAKPEEVEAITRELVEVCKEKSDRKLQIDAMKIFYSYLFNSMQLQPPSKPKEATVAELPRLSREDILQLQTAHEIKRSIPMSIEKTED